MSKEIEAASIEISEGRGSYANESVYPMPSGIKYSGALAGVESSVLTKFEMIAINGHVELTRMVALGRITSEDAATIAINHARIMTKYLQSEK